MRSVRFLLTFLVLLTVCNSTLFSQTNSSPSSKMIFSLDSIAGFDENAEKNNAINKGLYGMEFNAYMNIQKRIFVNNKYRLPFFDHEANFVANYSAKRYSSATINNAPCVNEDFEANSFTGWAISQGSTNAIASGTQAYGACIDNPCPTSISTGSLASIVTTPFLDPVINISIPNSPFGGTKVAKLNTNTTFLGGNFIFKAVKLTQNFPVTVNNSLFDFAYYAVMDASSPHQCCEQPYMYVKMRDCFGNLLTSCPVFSITVPGSGCAGTGPTSWTTTSGIARSNGWQQYSIDLATYIGCNITIEVTVGHCEFGGHFGYAYFDSRCNQMDFGVNGNLVNAPSTSPVSATVACASTATLTAPSGLGPYLWNGPAGSGITSNTNQIISTTVPGSYSISMSPLGICNPINRILSLTFPPPTTITATPATLCANGTTSSTLTASGASSYTWAPGGSTLSSIVVTPTITTIYTLTARTGTCTGTFTTQVTVNSNPSITVVSSNTSVCPGQSALLTALGGNTYVWNPGGATSNPLSVSPVVPTTYTVTGTATTGCSSTATVSIGITLSPTVQIFIFTPTLICSGAAVSMIATGASITWQPGNISSPNVIFNPTTTTTYTAFGVSGACTSSATILITVDPGPPITITPNPTLVCPGNSTTLTATAPTAVGLFTWNPGGSNASSIVVTPTLAGGYSVSATNALGCVSTFTANPNISPLPVIVLSPSSPSVCLGSATTLSATGATSYTWNPGGLTGSVVSVSPAANTTYTVTGANAAGCTSQNTVTVIVNSLPIVAATAAPPSICAGSCFTFTPSGANTYTFVPGTFCPLLNTTYTITGTDLNGCVSNPAFVTVTVNTGPSLITTASPATICAGSSSTLNSTGATSFTWTHNGSNSATQVVTPTVTTIYTVTGANAFGCTTVNTVTVTVNPVPSISITPVSPTICAGSSATLTATGAASYTWNPGGLTGPSVIVSPAANTTFTAIGSNGLCTGQNTVFVTVTPIPTLVANFVPPTICAGSCATLNTTGVLTFTITGGLTAVSCPTISTNYTVTGSNGSCLSNAVVGTLSVISGPAITATASPAVICQGASANLGATGALSYTWQPGNIVGSAISVTPAVTTVYTVTGVNASGCTSNQTVTVFVNPPVTLTVSATPGTICSGGTSFLTAAGATSFTWQPGSLSGSAIFVSPLVTTVYTVTGNNGGCIGSTVVTVVVNTTPTVNITASALSICAGSSATLTASGAPGYTWSTGSTATVIVVTPSINTTYSLIGANGTCTSNIAFVTVTVNAAPNLSVGANPATICAGNNSTLSASGAISYTWQPGNLPGASVVVSPAVSTIYTVTGANAIGCTSTRTLNLTVNPGVSVSASALPVSICVGSSANLTAIGATSYTWQPGGISGNPISVSPLVTTIYTVTGTSLGCSGQATVLVTVLPTPNVSITASPANVCAGSCATLTASGAGSFTWSTGSTGPVVTVCPTLTTTYTVIGSSGGCAGSATQTISVSFPPAISASSNPSSICPGSSSTLTAIGGVSYTWQPGSLIGSPVTVNPLVTTTYTVTGINASGCTGTSTTTVVVNPIPVVTASATSNTICLGQSTTLFANGATSYTWFPGAITGGTITVSPLVPTLYSVIGSNGSCTGTASTIVFVNTNPVINITASAPVICAGSNVTFTASGALNYTWTPGFSTANPITIFSPASSATFTVTGANASGCLGTQTISFIVNPIPSLTVSSTNNTICVGSSITLNGSGATTYTWSTGAVGQNLTVAPATTTVYTLFGSNGTCTSSVNYTVFVNTGPLLSANASTTSVCAGFTTALLGIGATSYTWEPGSSTSNPFVVSPLASTVYTVTGSNGLCISTATIAITVNQLPIVVATSSQSLICIGSTVTLIASGAVTYTWIPSLVGGSTFTDTPLVPTTYTVVGFDAVGCPGFGTVAVNVLPAPIVTVSASNPVICLGNSTTLFAGGATNYTWNPGSQNGSSIVVTPASTTIYTVTGDNGSCGSSATVAVTVNSLPVITASAVNSPLCAGNTLTLIANSLSASLFTWTPTGLNGAIITDTPVISTTYTVTGEDGNGCLNTALVSVVVNSSPFITAVALPPSICQGGTVSLSANGANTYTWSPNAQTGSPVTETPVVSTVYTVTGTDANGCIGSDTVNVTVIANPTIVISPLNSSVCIGSSATLTATGANNYTWLPSGTASSVTVENPTSLTTYTVIGDNLGICFSTATVNVFVNPLPAGVLASSAGTVSCSNPTINLFGICTDTNVSYNWTGPQGYNVPNVQNPIVVGIWGTFTLTVVDNITGCSSTVTVNVPTDNSIPLVNAVASGTITCAVSVVTITAVNTTTNPAYKWSGPNGFTSIAQTATVALQGIYTVTVTDLSSGCSATAAVAVGIQTNVTITATISPATCSGGTSNNDGKITVSGFVALDKFDLVSGTTYTGTATYITAALIPTNGIITSNLANPSTTVAYTIRLFDTGGCIKDTTLFLIPVDCSLRTLGIAKAASAPRINNDGSYNLTYSVVVKNYDLSFLKNVSLTENLSATFPSPTTFTVYSDSTKISAGSNLTLNQAGFDGSTQTNLLIPGTSTLAAGKIDTIQFTIRVRTASFFVPFSNSVLGQGVNGENKIIADSSQSGLNPDPDGDLNPYNNNKATQTLFIPKTFFGITKVGEINKSDNASFDVSYTLTLHNLGNDTLRNVSLNDSLLGKTIRDGATYSIRSGPVSSGSDLVVNSSYNGSTDIKLIDPSKSKMSPNTLSSIRFVINVVPGTVTQLSNSAYGSVRVANSATSSVLLSDTSMTGNNPDTNNNGVWNEAEDNIPTVILIPLTQDFFIPEGFSPNGDNINDVFVIKGLPNDGENSLTIFNRWGNKVYKNGNYDNSWDGTPNVSGTLGKDKLPIGTYYYILDMKGSGLKPVTGYITLQY